MKKANTLKKTILILIVACLVSLISLAFSALPKATNSQEAKAEDTPISKEEEIDKEEEPFQPTPQTITFQDENGNPGLIDHTIVPSTDPKYDWMNETNHFKTYFSSDAFGDTDNIKYQVGDAWATFRSIKGLKIEGKDLDFNDLTPKTQEEKDQKKGKKITETKFGYPKIYQDQTEDAYISAEYSIDSEQLLEELVLNKYQDISEISQEFTLHNCYFEKEESGQINFYHQDSKELLFYIPKPVMYEKENPEEKNLDLHYEINQLSSDRYQLTKVIDSQGKSWLSSKDRTYPVVIDASISYGDESTFNEANSFPISVSVLDSTHFVVAYQKQTAYFRGYAKIGTVSDSTITYGDESMFNNYSLTSMSFFVSSLDSSHVVVVYRLVDSYTIPALWAKIGTVSDTNVISFGGGSKFYQGGGGGTGTYLYSVSGLDSTHFVVTYGWFQDNYNYGSQVRIGTRSGDSISSWGDVSYFNYQRYTSRTTRLNNTRFVMAYQHKQQGYSAARIGTRSGSSILWSSEYIFCDYDTGHISVSTLDETHFVVAYSRDAKIGTVSGTGTSASITYSSSEYRFNDVSTTNISVSALDSTHFVVAYKDAGGDNYGHAKIGTVTGTGASASIEYSSSEYTFNLAITDSISVSKLNSTHFVVGYRDYGGDYYGHARIGTLTANIYNIPDFPDWTGYGLWDDSTQLGPGNDSTALDTIVYIKDTPGKKVVEFKVTGDSDLAGVAVGSNETNGKAFVDGLTGQTNITNKKLYIKKLAGYTSAYVCPDATNLSGVYTTCSNVYDPAAYGRLSTTSQDGVDYWLIDLLVSEGTGAGNGVAGEEEAAVPEFTTLTLIIAAVAGFGIYLLIRRRKQLEGKIRE